MAAKNSQTSHPRILMPAKCIFFRKKKLPRKLVPLRYLKKEMSDEFDFLHAVSLKTCYKLIL